MLSFVLLIAILAMFTWHVYSIESSLEPVKPKKKVIEDENARDGEENDYNYIREHAALDEEHENNVQENLPQGETDAEPKETNSKEKSKSGKIENEKLSSSRFQLSKRAFNQSMLYILAFFIVFLPSIVTVFTRSLKICPSCNDSDFMLWWMSIFYPIGGVANILIYTRPKMFKLQQDLPQASCFVCFIIVICAGREVPSIADLVGIQDSENNEECFDDNENREDNNEQNLLELKIDRVPKFLRSLSGLSDNLYDTDKAFENRHFYERDPNVEMRNDGDLKMSIGPSS